MYHSPRAAMALGIFLFAAPSAYAQMTIESPKNGDTVRCRTVVKGTAPAGQPVWLVIHPLTGDDYFIQPSVKISGRNEWTVTPYFGRREDGGVEFEMQAVSGPSAQLKEGDVLGDWPKGSASSPTVHVKRGAC